jgi:hypothetical protein
MVDPAHERDLLFGLLAHQIGLIDQGQLVATLQAWTRDKAPTLADHLADRGDLDTEQRLSVEAMVELHLRKHGGDAARSLAALPAPPPPTASGSASSDPTPGAAWAPSSSRWTPSSTARSPSSRSSTSTPTTR